MLKKTPLFSFCFSSVQFSCLHFFQYFDGLKHFLTAARKIEVGKYGEPS